MIRTYEELLTLPTWEERFRYLCLNAVISDPTFGGRRYLNQRFYNSPEWKRVRDIVILRDNGWDLGIEGYDIPNGRAVIHHMNPLEPDDILHSTTNLMDPRYLITVSADTHRAIHFGPQQPNPSGLQQERRPNDTCPWKMV